MKRIEILNLPQVFEQLKDAKGLGFAYALMKNKKIIEAERENLVTTIALKDDYRLFLNKMNTLLEEYVIKTDVMQLETVEMQPEKSREEFTEKVKALHVEYAEAIKQRREDLREYKDFIKQDANIDFYYINESHLPDNLTSHDLLMVSELINFNQRTKEKVELSRYQILSYTNIFSNMIEISTYGVGCEARNKCLQNFVILRNKHSELYNNEIIKDWVRYENERKELAESCADIDIYGDVLIKHNTSTQDDQYVIKEMDLFSSKLSELNSKYEKELAAFYTFLNEKVEIDICKITPEELSQDINLDQLQTLEIFLKN